MYDRDGSGESLFHNIWDFESEDKKYEKLKSNQKHETDNQKYEKIVNQDFSPPSFLHRFNRW